MQSAPLIDISIANNDLGKFDPRYFAMLHAAVAIVGHDELEAGHANEVLEYYTYLLNLNIPNCPASLQLNNSLNKKPMDDVNWHMQKMQEIDTKISKYIENQKSLTLMLMKGVMNHINECCDKTGFCYLASGWVSSRKMDGHFAGLKIRKMPDGQFAVSVINHGAGIQYHTVLGQSGFKIKRSYQSDEFILDLTTSNGRDCIRQILELSYLIPPENSNSYSEDDLYGLLMVYGKHQPLTIRQWEW